MGSEVTQLLEQHRNGDALALEALANLLYPELKAMALRRTAGDEHLGATALVNETFVKLLEGGALRTQDQQQFFGLSATIMRRVIIDEVRYAHAQKRAAPSVTFADERMGDDSQESAEFLLQLEDLLKKLERDDAQLVRVFECRYFAGYTTSETADALGLSVRSTERMWASARERIARLIGDRSPN